MDRLSPTKVVQLLLLLALASPAVSAGERKGDMQRGPTRNPHGPALKTPCGSCHTSTSWSPIRPIPEFDHNRETSFPLRGMHEKVACGLCHTKLVFSDVGTKCAECHADIHRRQFGAKCEDCHNVRGWQDGIKSTQEHSARFPLIGAHATVACDTCHVNAAVGRFVGLSTQCASCHVNDFNTAKSVDHRGAGFSLTCESCHNMNTWLGVKFDHAATGFVLAGAHAQLDCAACHVGGRFKGTPADCFNCHVKDFNATDNPPHASAGFPKDCSVCHGTVDWNNAKFDHNTSQFPLTGAHVSVTCNACHIGGRFVGTPLACYGCHVNDFNGTTNPNHRASGLATDCTQCHTTVNWQNAKFDHSLVKFPLTGAHVSLACNSCHVGGQFSNAPTACIGCHLADVNKTTDPNHNAAGFPQDCSLCHSTVNWLGATFNHNTATKFALTGAHAQAACAQCHINNVFAGTPAQCSGCHLPDFNKAANPNHVASGFPQTCDTCHTTAAWQPANFDHAKTAFPLTGAHVTTQCLLCHVKNNFKTITTQCSGCHMKEFQTTSNPNHVAASLPQDCSLCHTTVNWNGATFNHNTATKFPLTGAHIPLQCAQCHINNKFAGTPMDCSGCHMPDFTKAANPNHVKSGFPQTCDVCHTTAAWQPANFDHNKTAFPLTGAHVTTLCLICHVNNNFTTVSTQCVGCHLTDFNKTTSPNHVQAGFPQDCQVCHVTTAWTPAAFDHQKTTFPLTGAHVKTQCLLCHINNNFTTLPLQCSGCHMPDFNKTTNPNHVKSGFPQTCDTCHTTNAWQPASFDHSKTGFPLTGTHVSTPCLQCHINNNYTLNSPACATCHMASDNSTTNPNHKSAGFPTDCSMCHSTVNWTSATFDHSKTGFPLTGAHAPLQCAQCHVNNNYNLTTAACSTCHLPEYNSTTNPNHKTAGFPTDCTLCHSTTNWTSATFDHAKTGFPLTGTHTTTACAACHVGNNYNLTSAACANCHQTEYNATTNPNHKAAGFSTDCSLCHTTVNWAGAVFDHSKTGFTLTGTHVTTACALCHVNNNYALNSPACATCHMASYNSTTNPNHVAAGFPTDCSICHSTVNWTSATFNHANTGFPLTGTHVTTACAACHVNNNYNLTSAACATCHLTTYNTTTNPNHAAAGFPTDCSLCHSTVDWTGAVFNHATTGFTLTGTHVTTPCLSCHVNNNYKLNTAACATCHIASYNSTTNPNHVTSGFPTDCSLCHSTVDWTGAVFNHATTGFTLSGTHLTTPCLSCHVNNNYTLTSAACANCHLAAYQATTNPNHVAAGFPTTCDTCHNFTNWAGAVFTHPTSPFALTGAHLTVACTACHINNVFVGTPTDCYSCHKVDYTGTTNPAHAAAGFPTTCATCHTTTAWTGATFNHTWFPITKGNHNVACANCHINSADYTVFSCTTGACHPKASTDPHHNGNKNYVYNPTSCYGCHKNGGG